MIFADTSGLIAVFDTKDARHDAARAAWQQLAADGTPLLTTRLVFAETVTHLRRRTGWETSTTVGDGLLCSDGVEIADPTDEQFAAAWREFVRNADPKLSLCDAASFVVMRDRGVRTALTFDRHFSGAGFELLPA